MTCAPLMLVDRYMSIRVESWGHHGSFKLRTVQKKSADSDLIRLLEEIGSCLSNHFMFEIWNKVEYNFRAVEKKTEFRPSSYLFLFRFEINSDLPYLNNGFDVSSLQLPFLIKNDYKEGCSCLITWNYKGLKKKTKHTRTQTNKVIRILLP